MKKEKLIKILMQNIQLKNIQNINLYLRIKSCDYILS